MNAAPELAPVREAHRFDEKSLEAHLRTALLGFEGLDAISQFHGGQSNPTFMIESGERRWVLRKKPPGELLPSAHAVEREYRVQEALRDHGVPVPEMMFLCEDDSVIGTPFYVMEHLEGRIFEHPLLMELSPAERTKIFDSMNWTLVALHSVDYRAAGLEDFGRSGNYFARQISRWTRQWELSKQRDIPAMDELVRWLPNNIPPGDETSVVHGDFRLGNLVYAPDRPEVIGVLDWELSTLGHPLGDLGYNVSGYWIPHTVRHGMGGADLEGLGIPSGEDYVRDYCRRTGREPLDVRFHVVFSMFRFAAIVEGVLARGRAGNASSTNAEEVGAQTEPYAEAAWELVKRRLS